MAPLRLMRPRRRPCASAAGAGSSTSRAAQASARRHRCRSTQWRRPPSSRSRGSSPTATRRMACWSTRSAPARSSQSCGWTRADCSTSRKRRAATRAARKPSMSPDRSDRSAGWPSPGDRGGDRLSLLGARLVHLRCGLERRWRDRPGHHLICGRCCWTRPKAAELEAHGRTEAAVLVPMHGWPDSPGLVLTERRSSPEAPRRGDLLPRRQAG